MKWGFLSPLHFVTIIFACAVIISLHCILRHRSEKVQMITLLCLSTICLFNVAHGLIFSSNILEALPLHMCEINALLLPAAILTRNKTVNNLLLLWSLGAIAAIVVNSAQANYEILSITFFKYYFSHVFEFGIPILMFSLGLVKKDPKCIRSTLTITVIAYTLVHHVNMAINHFGQYLVGKECNVNYMYSITPKNPVFDLFYAIIPSPYWYLFLALPIVLIYLMFVYWKQLNFHKRKPS